VLLWNHFFLLCLDDQLIQIPSAHTLASSMGPFCGTKMLFLHIASGSGRSRVRFVLGDRLHEIAALLFWRGNSLGDNNRVFVAFRKIKSLDLREQNLRLSRKSLPSLNKGRVHRSESSGIGVLVKTSPVELLRGLVALVPGPEQWFLLGDSALEHVDISSPNLRAFALRFVMNLWLFRGLEDALGCGLVNRVDLFHNSGGNSAFLGGVYVVTGEFLFGVLLD